MKNEYYRQCSFKSDKGRVDTAWIPEHGAKVGKRMHFDDDETEVWTVTAVYERQAADYLRERQQDYKHQRKVSDI